MFAPELAPLLPAETAEHKTVVGSLGEFDEAYFRSIADDGKDEWIALGMENCRNQKYYTVFDDTGNKVGIVGMYDTDTEQNLTHVVVDQKYRGQGLVKQFYKKLLEADGVDSLVATVSIGNVRSVRAHEKAGFMKTSDAAYEQTFGKYRFVYESPDKKE